MSVSVLRLFSPDICGKDHSLYALSEIPAFDYFITLFFILDCNSAKSSYLEHPFQFLHGNRASDSAAVSFFILLYSFGEVTLLQDIRDRKASSRL